MRMPYPRKNSTSFRMVSNGISLHRSVSSRHKCAAGKPVCSKIRSTSARNSSCSICLADTFTFSTNSGRIVSSSAVSCSAVRNTKLPDTFPHSFHPSQSSYECWTYGIPRKHPSSWRIILCPDFFPVFLAESLLRIPTSLPDESGRA